MSLRVRKLSPIAKIPKKATADSIGYDLYALQSCCVPKRGKLLVDTGIAIKVPPGTYGRIAPRSGLASRYHIDVGGGVIDRDYYGRVKVLLFNLGDEDYYGMLLFVSCLHYY